MGTGVKTLTSKQTNANVVVTAENGATKTYTITIVKSEDANTTESDENIEKNNQEGLKNLKINELNLEPNFQTDIYEYNLKYIGEDTKLNIQAEPTDESYKVEIVGNEELKEGENVITILVSDSNEDNVAIYQIIVNKSLVDEEKIAKEKQEKEENTKKIITIVAAAIIIIILIIIIKKIKNRSKYDNEYSEVSFYGRNEQENDEKNEYKINKNQNEFEEMSKETAKKTFLNEYNNKNEYKQSKKGRGKRFKD